MIETGGGALVALAWSVGIRAELRFLYGSALPSAGAEVLPGRNVHGWDLHGDVTLTVLTVLGVAFLLAAPWVARGVAALDVAAAETLLGPDSARSRPTGWRRSPRAGPRWSPPRVVLAEDSVLLREGLVRLIERVEIQVVSAVGDADQLLRAQDPGHHRLRRRHGLLHPALIGEDAPGAPVDGGHALVAVHAL